MKQKLGTIALPIFILLTLVILASVWEQPQNAFIRDGLYCYEHGDPATLSCEVLP